MKKIPLVYIHADMTREHARFEKHQIACSEPLNLNIHFHMLLLDGVYVDGRELRGQQRFQRVKAPDLAELEQLVYTISERTGRYLERQGLLMRDLDNSYLALEPQDDTGLEGVLGSSITYRIAVGPHEGRKAFCLQSLPLPVDNLQFT